ncbi:MAG TPA: cytidylate kinase-like family protein [Vitreimonas sp.]|nr:cytidylate kinase-like family protein [Vitreimonas sp.]
MSLHYYPLVNKIINTLNIKDRIFNQYSADAESSFVRPFITIAREPGSGGAPIAKAVADKLGFTFVDDQLIEEIANSTKQRKAAIKAIDEKSRSKIDDIVHSILNPEYIDDLTYVTELVKVMLAYALQGHVVILGRGANFICPFAKGLHINITAPYDRRVKRAMDFEGLNEAQAKEVIAKVEKERRSFVKQYLRKDIDKCNSYDLTINTQYFQVNEARDVILEAFYRKFSRSIRYGAFFK